LGGQRRERGERQDQAEDNNFVHNQNSL